MWHLATKLVLYIPARYLWYGRMHNQQGHWMRRLSMARYQGRFNVKNKQTHTRPRQHTQGRVRTDSNYSSERDSNSVATECREAENQIHRER